MKTYQTPQIYIVETDIMDTVLSGSGAIGTTDPFYSPERDFSDFE